MKILKVLLLALLLLIAIMVYRTVTIESRQLATDPVAIEHFDANALAEKLSAGLKIKTVSNHDAAVTNREPFAAFRALLAQQFPAMHQALELELVADTMLFRWRGADPSLPPIMLMAHYDVVPVQAETVDRWSFDPFSGQIRDGYVLGRGAFDDKG